MSKTSYSIINVIGYYDTIKNQAMEIYLICSVALKKVYVWHKEKKTGMAIRQNIKRNINTDFIISTT
jgi:hypothetical protein